MLANHSKDKSIVDKVFTVVAKAKEAKEKFGQENVIDATIGVLCNEDAQFVNFKTVSEVYKNLPDNEIAAYASSFAGDPKYLECVKEVVLGKDYKEEFKDSFIDAVATPGGSGAVSNTIWNYVDKGETILIPDWMWESYKIMSEEFGVKYELYSLFNEEGTFNIADFKQKAEKIIEKQGKVLAVINDPCHNPTGYSLSMDEWKELREFFIKASSKGNIILLNDVAYIDYDFRGEKETREYMNYFRGLPENVLVIFAFSISKAFTEYGLRVGAQLALSSSKKVTDDFKRANEFSCRSRWSNISRGGMRLFSDIVSNPELFDKLKKERNEYVALMKERADIFINEAKEEGLPMCTYRGGFFITVPLGDDTEKIGLELQKENIFTVILDKGLRVAICSVPKRQLHGLPAKIKKVIDRVK
ncbi:aminotransferase class I/II-fold pyridoxal phosphate-dependent enzyme [Sebaldella sp. S0638]|uniref:pyridoxal phosphate-dependent aminotransferase n=1 Tax=Sebaldella sp. S0638 TaxID=2957809 RepID=UPI00209CCEE4|nr:aminotransferase class I/II-fold pyridoxal phosphate-dependent enzyme [Sebaldella sp. S0638]